MAQTKTDTKLECLDRALRLSENKPAGDREAEGVLEDAKTFYDWVKGNS
jgi:hypothetical protein